MAEYIDNVKVGNADYRVQPTLYGTCGDPAATAAKTVTIANFALVTGVTVHVKFTYANGVANPTLNVSGTGDIAIKRYGTTAPSTSAASSWNAGAVVSFTYDGTNWQMNDWLNNDTNTKVTQTAANTNDVVYPVLLATSAATTAQTNTVNKAAEFTYNPKTKALTTGGAINGYTLAAASAKAVDTTIAQNSSSANLPTSAAVAALVAALDIGLYVDGSGYLCQTVS